MMKKRQYALVARLIMAAIILSPTACSASPIANASAVVRQIDFADGVFRITNGGSYVFSGAYEGQILIDATKKDIVELVLDGAALHNPSGGPAILALCSKRVELILSKGTVNTKNSDIIKKRFSGINNIICEKKDVYNSFQLANFWRLSVCLGI